MLNHSNYYLQLFIYNGDCNKLNKQQNVEILTLILISFVL